MPYVEAGASRLYYESHGEGPPMVLLHGVGGNHASWFNQVPTFAKSWRVIVVDQRGFGNSTDAEELGRSAFVDDLERLLDDLAIGRTVIIAQSMGGGTAVGFTCAHPDRVAGLVLCDTLVWLEPSDLLRPKLEETAVRTQGLSQLERVLGPRTRWDEPERSLLYEQIASFNSVNMRTVKGRFERRTTAELAASGVPILFIAGEDDVLFEPSSIRAVSEATAGSRYIEIAGAGHSAYFERPREFNRAVLAFMAEMGPASGT